MANPNFDWLDVVGVPYLFNIGFLVLFVTLLIPALLLSYLGKYISEDDFFC